jgi:peptide/nickel transport system permease protein
VDRLVIIITSGFAAVPAFVAAVILVAVFAVDLKWFPVFGSGVSFGSDVWHLTLPAIALALAASGYCARITRTAVIEERQKEHVDIARVRGLPELRIIRRHIVRNSLVPITTVVGLTIASLIAGTVVVEQAFNLNGIGSLLVLSVENHDFPVVQAVTLIMVAAFIVVNTIVDLTYPLLDPRIKIGKRA